MRRSRRLALSAATVCVALAIGAADRRPGAAREGPGGAAAARSGPDVARDGGRRGVPAPAGAGRAEHAARRVDPTHPASASADASDDARLAQPDAARPAPIALEDPLRAFGVALAVAGHDPGAPRALDLWRVGTNGRAARVARGRSAPDGALVFAPLVLPARPVELVVTPRGASPRDPGASRPVPVRRDPAAPRVVATRRGDGLVLRVAAAEHGGAIVVERAAVEAGAAPALLARVDLATGADAVAPPVEIALPDGRAAALQVVQIDPDGRRSVPRPVFVDDDANDPMQE